jgi:hypothetical protein
VLQMRGICPECIKGGKVESVFLLCELVVWEKHFVDER